MANTSAPGALQVVKTPDYEAMVVGAHPDDADFGTAATCALWARQGKKIVWVIMTDGTEGSEIPSLVDTEFMLEREQEQRASAESLGVKAVEFLRFPDGHLTNSEAARKAMVRLIRKYRPRVVFTHDPSQHILAPDPDERPDGTAYLNHPDHRAAGNIVLDAIFPAAGNPRAYRELLAEGFVPYKVHELYLFFSAEANTFIDISETLELKVKALAYHDTQFGTDVPSLEDMQKNASWVAETAKKKKGVDFKYAEGFRRIKLYIPKDNELPPEGQV